MAAGMIDRVNQAFTPALAATAVGVYALIVTGATASLVDTAGACSTWPTCAGASLVPPTSGTVAVAMAHRGTSLVVGVAILGLAVASWLLRTPRSVRWLVTLAAGLYPIQVGLGAMTAVSGGSAWLSATHLTVGLGIFGAMLLALLYWLEWETRSVASAFPSVPDDPRPASKGTTGAEPLPSRLGAYLRLTKPRLMWLLCIVALAGIGLAVNVTTAVVTPTVVIGTLAGGVLAIGASGTFNHVIECDIDRRMERTADRPVATELVPTRRALAFGTILAFASVAVFLALVNPLAAALGLGAIAFYSVIYTVVLKPNTTQNIVIGGAVGAFPALIGWAAVTGSIGLPALVLGALIFLWTPAHFYNLALAYKDDYARGGFPMLPVVRGERVTRRHIVYYLGATLGAVVMLGTVGGLGWLYIATAIVGTALFLGAIVHLFRHQTPASAMRTFHTSNLFLGALMFVIVVETLVV